MMWLILVEAFSLTCAIALTVAFDLTLTIPLALGANVVAEHGTENEVLLRREQIQRTGDDEADSLQAFAPSEIDIQVVPTSGLQDVRDALTFQS